MSVRNDVRLIGRLTKDPVQKQTQSGKVVDSFTIAVDRNYKDANGNRQADFIPIVAWGKTAEIVSKYCKKGKQIAIQGRLQTRTYEDKDKVKHYITEVVADEIELLSDPKGKSNEHDTTDYEFDFDGFEPIDDENFEF